MIKRKTRSYYDKMGRASLNSGIFNIPEFRDAPMKMYLREVKFIS